MKPELKAKWVAALRSGKYRQAKEFLYEANGGGYCCLGVLGCVLGIDQETLAYKGNMDGAAYNFVYEHINKEQASNLAIRMNDAGVPFSEIADYIEAHL